MLGILLTVIEILKLPHMCFLELEHHELAFIFHQLFLEGAEDIERTTQIGQEDLFVRTTPSTADSLEKTSDLGLRMSL